MYELARIHYIQVLYIPTYFVYILFLIQPIFICFAFPIIHIFIQPLIFKNTLIVSTFTSLQKTTTESPDFQCLKLAHHVFIMATSHNHSRFFAYYIWNSGIQIPQQIHIFSLSVCIENLVLTIIFHCLDYIIPINVCAASL